MIAVDCHGLLQIAIDCNRLLLIAMDCWCLLRYDPSRPPIVTGAPATMDVAAPSATIPVKGANFAPTAENLRLSLIHISEPTRPY